LLPNIRLLLSARAVGIRISK